ncbi:MAG: VWA domain-containing protein, partial [Candidatus Hydrogenedentes bacterium]|nr:VWA domain-containing protein [Candidatus Hydrogenedentota bacterium]
REVEVEIRDENVVGSELVATVTAYGGFFSAFIDNSDTFGTAGRDIFVRVLARSTYAHVVRADDPSETHIIESSVTDDVVDGSSLTIDLTANNTDDNNRAFSVHDALLTIAQYPAFYLDGALARIDTLFPVAGTVSFSNGTTLNMLRDDWSDWDVTHHEYGHYFMDVRNIESNPGGAHSIGENLAERLGKDVGIRLAWGEGFPTYFGTAGQARVGAASLTVPTVGDTGYTDTIDSSISYDLESSAAPAEKGEDDELAVQRTLFDLYDGASDGNDEVTLGDYVVYSTASASGATTLSAYWNQLILGVPMSQQVLYGCVFMDHRVSPEPTSPEEGAMFAGADPPPDFDWDERGAGPSFELDKFTVEFWNVDYTTNYFTSPEVDAPPWTPSEAEWDTILGSDDLIKWVVKGRNTSAPETGTYVSCARTLGGVDVGFVIDDTGSMGEEIGGVRAALTAFISELTMAERAVSINLISFKDAPVSLIVSRDLPAVQAQVDGLFASGGDDCPEASVEGLRLASKNVRAGGRVLFATDADAHAGLDIPGTIAALRAKGIRVDVLLTGSCSESFKRGTYFGNTLGEFYAIPPHCNDGDCLDENDGAKSPPDCEGPDCNTPIVTPEAYPAGSIAVFSAFAAETGGVFAFVPEVNSFDPDGITRFNNVALNLMLGAAFPAIPNVDPPRGNRGTTINIVARGSNTNFNSSSTIAFSGTGITVNSGEATSATSFQANITIAPEAELGFRDITITTDPGEGSEELATGVGVFEVEDVLVGPTITGVSPAQAALGETLDVIVTGANTNFSSASVATFGFGITVNSFTVVSATEGRVDITIDELNTTLGFHSVTVTTDGESASEFVPGPFLVTTTALAESIPRIVSANPEMGAPGQSLIVSVVGENTHFEEGVSVGAFSDEGVTVNDTSVISETEAQLDITIDVAAVGGFRDIVVTTGAEEAALLDGFEIGGNPPPIANAGPDQTLTASGATAQVTLNGSASSDANGSVEEFLWSGTPDPDDVETPVLNLAPGTYTFTLVVVDDEGAQSTADTVIITVETEETPPPPQCVLAAGMTLDGGLSRHSGDFLLLATATVLLLTLGCRRWPVWAALRK